MIKKMTQKRVPGMTQKTTPRNRVLPGPENLT